MRDDNLVDHVDTEEPLLAPDADDPPEKMSGWQLYFFSFNRWCEEGARWARILGVL